jgi:phage/plasmid-like protein (TIGR03299 family)
MAHLVESMFSVKKVPWHGLGVILDAAPESTAEALHVAGLDWKIGLEQLQLPDGTKVDRNAVLRITDRAVLGVVGIDWTPIQNEQAFKPFDPFLQAGAATIESAGSLKGGRRVWMLAKLNRPDSVIVPQADDRVAKYLLVAVGHDGTLSFSIGYSPTRVVCQNTLSVALSDKESTFVKIRHSSGAKGAIEALTAKVQEIDARFENVAQVFRALAGIAIKSEKQLRAYIDAVFPPPKKVEVAPDGAALLGGLLAKPHVSALPSPFSPEGGDMTAETKSRVFEEIARLFEFGKGNRAPGVAGTAWAAYNAVTEYNTWERGRSNDSRMDNVWLSQSGPVARALPAAVSQFLS